MSCKVLWNTLARIANLSAHLFFWVLSQCKLLICSEKWSGEVIRWFMTAHLFTISFFVQPLEMSFFVMKYFYSSEGWEVHLGQKKLEFCLNFKSGFRVLPTYIGIWPPLHKLYLILSDCHAGFVWWWSIGILLRCVGSWMLAIWNALYKQTISSWLLSSVTGRHQTDGQCRVHPLLTLVSSWNLD